MSMPGLPQGMRASVSAPRRKRVPPIVLLAGRKLARVPWGAYLVGPPLAALILLIVLLQILQGVDFDKVVPGFIHDWFKAEQTAPTVIIKRPEKRPVVEPPEFKWPFYRPKTQHQAGAPKSDTAKIVKNYTHFERVHVGKIIVDTGRKYASSKHDSASREYCYALLREDGVLSYQVNLAERRGQGTVRYHALKERHAAPLNIPLSTLRAFSRAHCRFSKG